MRRVRGGLPLAVLLAAAVARPGLAATPPQGLDVASYQHPNGAAVSWTQVRRDGATFAIVKATEGTSYTNPYFSSDYAQARKAGLVVGAYHFARPALPISTATDQANYFVKTAGSDAATGELPLALDLEVTGGLPAAELVQWAAAFLEQVKTLTGRTPIIYTYPYFWRTAMGNSTAFTSYPLWLADYRAGSPSSPLPGGWSRWTFWQYTSDGRLGGVPAIVDRDEFNGDQAQLTALATPPSGSTAPSPVPPLPLPALPAAPAAPHVPAAPRLP